MRNLIHALVVILALATQPLTASAGDTFFYAGDNYSEALYKIDKTTGATITTVPITVGGTPVVAVKGLAAQPGTGTLFAIVLESDPVDQPPTDWFKLVTIAPNTGIATVIGTLGDRFAGLAFVDLVPTEGPGVEALVGVTGDGAANPEQLFTIDTSNASTSFFLALGNGTDGEAIAWNPNDNMLYHLSGWASEPPPEGVTDIVFESIDLQTMVITDIPLSGATFTGGNGLTFDEATNQFFFSAGTDLPFGNGGFNATALFTVTTTGDLTPVGLTETYFGGMAFSDQVPVELQSFSIE